MILAVATAPHIAANCSASDCLSGKHGREHARLIRMQHLQIHTQQALTNSKIICNIQTTPPKPLRHWPAIKETFMNLKSVALLIIASFLVSVPFYQAQAAYDMFLQVNPLQGEATSRGHERWMDVLTMDIGLKNPSASSLGATRPGKAQFGPLVLTKFVDKASVLLALAVSEGRRFPTAILEVLKDGGASPLVLRITLEDVTVTSVQTGLQGGTDVATETIELTYRRIKREYFPMDPVGRALPPIKSTWDVGTNQPF
jgi:type VI secretion system secreted protein Hcp